MNKIKNVFLVFISILTLGILFSVNTRVNAATLNLDLDYKVTNQMPGGLALYEVSDHMAVYNFQSPPDAVSPYNNSSLYTDLNGDTYSFNKAFVAKYRYDSPDRLGFSVTNKRDTLDLYYGITTSEVDFKNTNNSTTGSVYLKSGDRYSTYRTYDEVTMTSTEVKKLTISFDDLGPGNYSLDCGDVNRLVLFGFKINLGTPLMNVTIIDGNESEVKKVFQNECLEDLEDKICYSFDGYYLDLEFKNKFDNQNTPITGPITLYSKWVDSGCFNESKYWLTLYSMEKMHDWTYVHGEYHNYQFWNTKLNDVFTCLPGSNLLDHTYNWAIHDYDGKVYGIDLMGHVSKDSNGIKINVPTSGKLVVKMGCRDSNKSINAVLINENEDEIYATSGDTYWVKDSDDIRDIEYNLDSGGTYYIGATSYCIVFEIRFTPDTLKPLVQEANVEEFTYIRFVGIVYSDTIINPNDISFSITMTYIDETTKSVSYIPYVVDRITQNGNTYVAKVNGLDHSFSNSINNNEYYVVFVLKLTTAKFIGSKLYGKITYQDIEYTTSEVTI